MAAIHIRDVSEEVLGALKRRAARHERSLQKELRHVLATLAREEPPDELPPLDLKLSSAQPVTSWRREEIYGDEGR